MTERDKARQRKARRGGGSSLDKLRRAITMDALTAQMALLLVEAGRDADEWRGWGTTVASQIRISRADISGGGTSESPQRQLRRIAEYCVTYRLHPVAMCFEAQSGWSLSEKKKRKHFDALFRD